MFFLAGLRVQRQRGGPCRELGTWSMCCIYASKTPEARRAILLEELFYLLDASGEGLLRHEGADCGANRGPSNAAGVQR